MTVLSLGMSNGAFRIRPLGRAAAPLVSARIGRYHVPTYQESRLTEGLSRSLPGRRVCAAMSESNQNAGSAISVVLADDHPLLRAALRSALESQPDISVVGEASNGEEAVALVMELGPRVAILDISMPVLSGIDAARAIRAQRPEVAILVLTVHDENEHVREMLDTGVAGYLTKDALGDEVVQAVRVVAAGDVAMSPAVFDSAVRGVRQNAGTKSRQEQSLTKREREILRLTARGLTNIQMAAECGYSTRTVKGYLGSIFTKLQVGNRTEAVAEGLRRGIISVTDLRQSG